MNRELCMRGSIVRYFDEKGFGFIESGGKEYFFHVKSVSNRNEIESGAEVEFESETTTKGESAKAVRVVQAPRFIIIGNERIKISNVKHYGVKRESWGSGHPLTLVAGALLGKEDRKYLYLTTYQGDNFTFSDRKIDVDAVMAELDEKLAGR